MWIYYLLALSLLLTLAQSASLSITPSDEVKAESLVRTIRNVDFKVKNTILSKLFRDYPTIITGHLLQSSLSNAIGDIKPTPSDETVKSTSLSKSRVGHKLPMFSMMFPQVAPMVGVKVTGTDLLEEISVTLMPDMSTYDAINAAKVLYNYNNRDAISNPFSVEMAVLRAKRCAIIQSVSGVTGEWNVIVRDNAKQILHDDICIPRRSVMTMRPGYSVELKQNLEMNTTHPGS